MTNTLPPSYEPSQHLPRPKRPGAADDGTPEVESTVAPASYSVPERRSVVGENASPRRPSATEVGNSGVESGGSARQLPPARSQATAQPLPPAYAPQKSSRPRSPSAGTVSSSTSASRPSSSRGPYPQTVRPATASATGARRPATARPPAKQRRRGAASFLKFVIPVLLVAALAWPTWLVLHVDRSLNRVDALSGRTNTPGTTYLFAGSDSRAGWNPDDPTEGERSDSMILIHKAPGGQTAMVSLPRDTYVEIDGVGWNKLNAAFSIGGPKLAVQTVEQMTGLTIDHYVQIGMAGVGEIVDSLGGVNLCWDYDVSDPFSGMEWTAGCHDVDGTQALAFARMRKEDPTGDVGRTLRQRQVLAAVSDKALSWKTLMNPFEQLRLGNAAADALTVDRSTKVWNVGFLLLAMRSASASGLTGAPPISDYNAMYDVGSVMLLDEGRAPDFFQKLANGTLTPADFDQPE